MDIGDKVIERHKQGDHRRCGEDGLSGFVILKRDIKQF
jgi:hypothetical protein